MTELHVFCSSLQVTRTGTRYWSCSSAPRPSSEGSWASFSTTSCRVPESPEDWNPKRKLRIRTMCLPRRRWRKGRWRSWSWWRTCTCTTLRPTDSTPACAASGSSRSAPGTDRVRLSCRHPCATSGFGQGSLTWSCSGAHKRHALMLSTRRHVWSSQGQLSALVLLLARRSSSKRRVVGVFYLIH